MPNSSLETSIKFMDSKILKLEVSEAETKDWAQKIKAITTKNKFTKVQQNMLKNTWKNELMLMINWHTKVEKKQ
jgi:hypothetical protein